MHADIQSIALPPSDGALDIAAHRADIALHRHTHHGPSIRWHSTSPHMIYIAATGRLTGDTSQIHPSTHSLASQLRAAIAPHTALDRSLHRTPLHSPYIAVTPSLTHHTGASMTLTEADTALCHGHCIHMAAYIALHRSPSQITLKHMPARSVYILGERPDTSPPHRTGRPGSSVPCYTSKRT